MPVSVGRIRILVSPTYLPIVNQKGQRRKTGGDAARALQELRVALHCSIVSRIANKCTYVGTLRTTLKLSTNFFYGFFPVQTLHANKCISTYISVRVHCSTMQTKMHYRRQQIYIFKLVSFFTLSHRRLSISSGRYTIVVVNVVGRDWNEMELNGP